MIKHLHSVAVAIGLSVGLWPLHFTAAQSPKIETNPSPVRFGTTCIYSISNPPSNASTYSWEYKYTAPIATNWGMLSSTNTTPTQFVFEAIPGTFEIRCTIGLSGNILNPFPSPIVLTKTVIVPKPDGYTVTGTGVPTPLGSNCIITFHITQGGNATFYIAGFAQEKIKNLELYDYAGVVYAQPADTDWIPTGPGAPYADRYTISGGTIVDKKLYDDGNRAGYATRPNGDTLETLDQDIRIKFTYPDGSVDHANLPSRSFIFKKSGANSYEID